MCSLRNNVDNSFNKCDAVSTFKKPFVFVNDLKYFIKIERRQYACASLT